MHEEMAGLLTAFIHKVLSECSCVDLFADVTMAELSKLTQRVQGSTHPRLTQGYVNEGGRAQKVLQAL